MSLFLTLQPYFCKNIFPFISKLMHTTHHHSSIINCFSCNRSFYESYHIYPKYIIKQIHCNINVMPKTKLDYYLKLEIYITQEVYYYTQHQLSTLFGSVLFSWLKVRWLVECVFICIVVLPSIVLHFACVGCSVQLI